MKFFKKERIYLTTDVDEKYKILVNKSYALDWYSYDINNRLFYGIAFV